MNTQLSNTQIELIINFAIIFIFNVGLLYIIRCIFRTLKRLIKSIWYTIKRTIIRMKSKNQKGFKNYKSDVWYPNGTMYNKEKKKFEKPDYSKDK